MPEYLAPGVFIEEVDKGPKPIEAVGTSTACFIGFTEKAVMVSRIDGDIVTESLVNKPQLVTNWSQFVEKFGGLVQGAYLPYAGGVGRFWASTRTRTPNKLNAAWPAIDATRPRRIKSQPSA